MTDIVLYPDPVLRQVCKKVETGDTDVKSQVSELTKILMETGNGAGLAAPQIGVSKRFFALKTNEGKKSFLDVYINPEIVDTFGEEKKYFSTENKKGEARPFLEGCLSIPNIYGEVARYNKIKIKFLAINFKTWEHEQKEEILEGYKAIVFQHELDHLNGILFVDHVKTARKKMWKEVDGKMTEISYDELNLQD